MTTGQREPIRAFRTRACDVTCIVFTGTLKRARYLTWKSAREAGYEPGFGEIQVERAPELDGLAGLNKNDRCLSERYLDGR